MKEMSDVEQKEFINKLTNDELHEILRSASFHQMTTEEFINSPLAIGIRQRVTRREGDMEIVPFRQGSCSCNPIPLTRNGKQATYHDLCGVLKCRTCKEPVHIRVLEDIFNLYEY